MDLTKAGVPFCFNYVDYGRDTTLYVRAAVYDVSTGTPAFVQNVVMPSVALGLYSGNFTGVAGKTYLVISAIFTDGTYATPAPFRSPAARCFQDIGDSVVAFSFNWAAYDQNAALSVAASVYDMTTGSPVLITQQAMNHVAYGVYFGSFLATLNHTYEVLTAAYTDGTFTTPNPLYSPGGEALSGIPASFTNTFVAATLAGPSLTAVLAESNFQGGSMIAFTQGDTAVLNLTATDGQGNPVDLTGAVFTTQIKGPNGVVASFANAKHVANPDQVTYRGQYTLSLNAQDTAACGTGAHKEILTQVVQGSGVIYFHGPNILTVYPAVPLQ